MLAPLSNYWGGGGGWPPLAPPLPTPMITTLLLNDSPNRLKQRSNSVGDARPPDEYFGCPYY